MFPAARVRRASFLPREVRTSAATVISFLKFASPVFGPSKSDSPVGQASRPVPQLTWVQRFPPNLYANSLPERQAGGLSYTNKVLTEVSSWIDRMASAMSCAIDNDLIRLDFRASSESGIEFVKTTSFSPDSSIRRTAGPDSRSEEHTSELQS